MSRFPETGDRSRTLSLLSIVALVVLGLLWWARLSGMSLLERLIAWAAATTRWSELPWPLGLLTILTYRNSLRFTTSCTRIESLVHNEPSASQLARS